MKKRELNLHKHVSFAFIKQFKNVHEFLIYKLFTMKFAILFSLLVSTSLCISQGEYVDIGRPRNVNLDNYTQVNISPITNVSPNGVIPGWLHDYGWGCCHPLEDAIFALPNRQLINQQLNLVPIEGNSVCGLDNSQREFSTGMIRSVQKFKYGFFELNCNTPNSKFATPAFWLFGEGDAKSPYNEIDVFEGSTGDWIVQCNHSGYIDNQNHLQRVSEHETISSLPGTNFGGANVTYSLRWDPNKIVWYINGIPVRTKLECPDNPLSTTLVPSTNMEILVNYGITFRPHDFMYYLPDGFNNFIINNLRVFRRNYTPPFEFDKPVCNFSIENGNSTDCQLPTEIEYSQYVPIIVDLNDGYYPSHKFIWLLYNINENCIDPELIDGGEIDFCNEYNTKYSFDLNELLELSNIILDMNELYELEIIPYNTINNSYDDNFSCSRYFRTIPCNDRVEYRVNGIDVCQGSIETCTITINTADNHGKSRLVLDLTPVKTCEDKIFVSIQESDANYDRIGPEVFAWLNSEQLINRKHFNLEGFSEANNLILCPNTYYRIKVATTTGNNTWIEKTQLIFIEECQVNFIPTINEQQPGPIINIEQGDPIYLDLTENDLCSNDFRVVIQEALTGTLIARRDFEYYYQDNFIAHNDDRYTAGRIDLRNLIEDSSYILNCDVVYIVNVSTFGSICDDQILRTISFQINNCIQNTSDFLWRSNICWGRGEFEYDDYDVLTLATNDIEPIINPNVYLFSPDLISCNNRCAIVFFENGNPGIYTRHILTPNEFFTLRNRGELNLFDFIGNFTFIPNRAYTLRLISNIQPGGMSGITECHREDSTEKIIQTYNCIDLEFCCNFLEDPLQTEAMKERVSGYTKYYLSPNPSSREINIHLLGNEESIKIFNNFGELIFSTNKLNNGNNKILISTYNSGLYFLQVEYLDHSKPVWQTFIKL
jgi:hypothetical protein